jgi:predicted ferric reductase
MCLYVKGLGNYTNKVIKYAKKVNRTSRMYIEGPYGFHSLNIDDDNTYKDFLLVSGGIGCTPIFAVFR